MARTYITNGPSKTNQKAIRLETYGKQTSGKTKTTMARGCHGRPKKLKARNWKKTAKDGRTWRELAEKAKTHKGLWYQMMMMMMMMLIMMKMISRSILLRMRKFSENF
jgi:hypothetical protein